MFQIILFIRQLSCRSSASRCVVDLPAILVCSSSCLLRPATLTGRLVSLHVGAVAPLLELLDALAVCFQLLVHEAVGISADNAPNRRVVHDCQVVENLRGFCRICWRSSAGAQASMIVGHHVPPAWVPFRFWASPFASIWSYAGLLISPKSMLRPLQSVRKPPGSMQVNFIPHSGFTSLEMASVKPSTAHLLAQYMEKAGTPVVHQS
jgi:hypothetical protein